MFDKQDASREGFTRMHRTGTPPGTRMHRTGMHRRVAVFESLEVRLYPVSRLRQSADFHFLLFPLPRSVPLCLLVRPVSFIPLPSRSVPSSLLFRHFVLSHYFVPLI